MIDPFEDYSQEPFVQQTSEYYKAHYNNISENPLEPIYPKSRMSGDNSPL